MVNDPNNAELIRWSESGDSFFGMCSSLMLTEPAKRFVSAGSRTVRARSPGAVVQAQELCIIRTPAQHVRIPQNSAPAARCSEERQ